MYYTGGQKVLINDIVNETVTALKRKQSKSAESIKPWFDKLFQQLEFLNRKKIKLKTNAKIVPDTKSSTVAASS